MSGSVEQAAACYGGRPNFGSGVAASRFGANMEPGWDDRPDPD